MANIGSATAGKVLIGTGIGQSANFTDIGTNSGLTAHGVLLAQGNNAFTSISPGTLGYVLTAQGNNDPIWAPAPAGGTDLHTARYIVSAGGLTDGANYTTIQSAINAAVLAGGNQTVFIQPGTYTENITLAANINLSAYVCDAYTPNVIIKGKISCSYTGIASISGVQLLTNSDYVINQSGATQNVIRLINCYINVNDNTAINTSSASGISQIELYNCKQETSGNNILFTNSGAGKINIYGGIYNRDTGTSGACTVSGTGSVNLIGCSYFGNSITVTNHGTIQMSWSSLLGAISISGDSPSCSISNSQISNGGASCITINSGIILPVFNVNLSSPNTNVITGAGTLQYCGLLFGNSSTINVTTQVPYVMSNDALKVVTPGAYPYTTVPQDSVILVDSSSARTITPYASPATGQQHIIKDNGGQAASNNITITPSGKNIDGAASKTININYGSVTIVYNGTQWNVI